MNFVLRNSRLERRRSRRSLGKGVLVIVFIAAVLFFGSRMQILGSAAAVVGRPFWAAGNSIGSAFGSIGTYFSSKASLSSQNEMLNARIASMESEIAAASSTLAENELLLNAFNRTGRRDLIAAGVLKGPGSSPYDTLILDAGSDLGVKQGATVYLDGTMPIGSISQTYAGSSVARLFSASGEQLDVVIHTATSTSEAWSSTIHATAEGLGGGNFEVQVPQGVTVPVGSIVLMPGLNGGVIGTVEDAETDIAHSLQTLRFRSSFNEQMLEAVFVRQ